MANCGNYTLVSRRWNNKYSDIYVCMHLFIYIYIYIYTYLYLYITLMTHEVVHK